MKAAASMSDMSHMARPSLHRRPAAQDAVLLQPLDRQVDVVGAQIGKAAVLEMRAHRGLRLAQPAAAAFQFEENHLPIDSGELQIGPAGDASLCNRAAVTESRYSPSGTWVNRHCGSEPQHARISSDEQMFGAK